MNMRNLSCVYVFGDYQNAARKKSINSQHINEAHVSIISGNNFKWAEMAFEISWRKACLSQKALIINREA